MSKGCAVFQLQSLSGHLLTVMNVQMNRPYGAVDVAANLKGAVPKTATQKILVSLAEKGDLVQKTYGEDDATTRQSCS